MREDPIVSEVRQVREQLSRQFNFDVHAIFADLRKRQTLLGSRLVRRQQKKKGEEEAGHDQGPGLLHPGR
jgi:hypothetical protein